MSTRDRNIGDSKGTDSKERTVPAQPSIPKREEPRDTDRTNVYDAVFVFGDTDLNRSEARALAASKIQTNLYVVVGTSREQKYMIKTLLKSNSSPNANIMDTQRSDSTAGNIEVFDKLTFALRFAQADGWETGKVKIPLRVLVVSHTPHAARLEKNYIKEAPDMVVEYMRLTENSIRRVMEHKLQELIGDKVPNDNFIVKLINSGRERFKDSIQKE
ncbi:MAG TPA: hypothetical protein VND15_01530 [Candidatus Acidoferrales bacterium]|nr:hypothetical protein [Candidatus Acidoferrales bacterium]